MECDGRCGMRPLAKNKKKSKRKPTRLDQHVHFSFALHNDFIARPDAADIQGLLLHAVCGGKGHVRPNWCHVNRSGGRLQVIMVLVNYACRQPFEELKWQFLKVPGAFKMTEARVSSADEMLERLLIAPCLPSGTLGRPVEPDEEDGPVGRDALVLSWKEKFTYNYPLPHLSKNGTWQKPGFVFSKTIYRALSASSPLFAVDCEMCTTADQRSSLVRISVVDEECRVVMDTLVKPSVPIIDYLTAYSGVTRNMLQSVVTSLSDVQRAFSQRIPTNAILVGHSLNFDLNALKLMHPYVMDTSVLYNLSGDSNYLPSLKSLAERFLNVSIQDDNGHCSVEDACTTMKLVLLKLSNGAKFGHLASGWTMEDGELESLDDCACSARPAAGHRSSQPIPCRNCATLIRRICRKPNCTCVNVEHLIDCRKCWFSSNVDDPSNGGQAELVRTHADIYSGMLDDRVEPVWAVLDRCRKKATVVSQGDQCRLCRSTLCVRDGGGHVARPSLGEALQAFQGQLYEGDLNLIIVDVDGPDSALELDSQLISLANRQPLNSLLCLLFAGQASSRFLVRTRPE